MSTVSQLRKSSAISKAEQAAQHAAAVRRRIAPLTLSLAGLASFTAAAFHFGVWEGLITAGLSCFVMEWRVSGE